MNPFSRPVRSFYTALLEEGVEVLFDDRADRPGVKFKDADLLGIPLRVVIGARGLANGELEFSHRRDGEKHLVAPEDVLARVLGALGPHLG